MTTPAPPTSQTPLHRTSQTTSFSPLEDKAATLARQMKITAGCRFNAAKRLDGRDRGIVSRAAWLSAGVIILTVLPAYFHLSEIDKAFADFVTVLLSIGIIVYSLLQYSNNDPVNATRHHQCGLEVNALRREFTNSPDFSPQKLFEFSNSYDLILAKYTQNHDDCDMRKYIRDYPEEFTARKDGFWKSLRNLLPDFKGLVIDLIFWIGTGMFAAFIVKSFL